MQYELDPVRFLLVRARAARTLRNFEDESNFEKCAQRITELEGLIQKTVELHESVDASIEWRGAWAQHIETLKALKIVDNT